MNEFKYIVWNKEQDKPATREEIAALHDEDNQIFTSWADDGVVTVNLEYYSRDKFELRAVAN